LEYSCELVFMFMKLLRMENGYGYSSKILSFNAIVAN
jgi:hypothetical protein